MNIIVTGGAGFIGSNFVFHMLKKYADTRLLFISSQSTIRTRKILNIMWRVKLTGTAAWMKQKWMV